MTRLADWRGSSPLLRVARGRAIPPLLLCYVGGRDHHARENRRFADALPEAGTTATVFEAKDKTHLRIELEIGLRDDPVTAEILRFFGSLRAPP